MNTQITIPRLQERSYIFPDPLNASKEGLLAWGGDLHPQRLIEAYKEGIFPWYSPGDPLLWWSPDPRLVLYPKDLKVSKSLKKSIKKYEVRVNTNFEKVIATCKGLREDTWISDEMQEAYMKLHELGVAKSVECYFEDELVGGLYGLLIGSIFCGESMFSQKSDASKVALWSLCRMMEQNGGELIDCQMPTPHLESLGAVRMEREIFLDILHKYSEKRIELQ